MNLKEFFAPSLREGPLDKTFSPPPEVPVDGGADMGAEPGMDPGMEPGMEGDPNMTQDVAKMSASSLQFFTKNVQSAVSKYATLEQEGFDPSALEQFAGALDGLAFNMYQQVQEPAARQAFESDYQKCAADWSKDLTKLFDKVLKLKGHAGPY